MAKEALKLKNEERNTAFCLAVIGGKVEMCKIMVEKNKELMTIRGSENMMPLYLAASHGQYDMVTYLYDHSLQIASDSWTDDDRNRVFLKCIEVDFFDVALKILDVNKEIQPPQEKYLCNVLYMLARKPSAFDDERTNIIHRIIRSGSLPKESEAAHIY